MNSYFKQHRNNLLKSAGLTQISTDRYEYIVSNEELNNGILNEAKDLSYPLRKEVKRDRIVANSIGMEKAMQETTKIIMDEIMEGIEKWLHSEVIPIIEGEISNIGNTNSTKRKDNTDGAYKLGSRVGKALADIITRNIGNI